MQRVDLQRLLKRINGLGIVLLLAIERAKKVIGVRIGGIDLQHFLKVGDRLGGLGLAAMHQPKVVPDARILGVLGGRLLQRRLRFREFLLVEERDSLVQGGDGQRRIQLVGGIELRHRLIHLLLVHHRNT